MIKVLARYSEELLIHLMRQFDKTSTRNKHSDVRHILNALTTQTNLQVLSFHLKMLKCEIHANSLISTNAR